MKCRTAVNYVNRLLVRFVSIETFSRFYYRKNIKRFYRNKYPLTLAAFRGKRPKSDDGGTECHKCS